MLRLEIPVFLIFFAFMIGGPVFTNLLIYRTCYVTLGFNETECALLGTKNASEKTAELEKIVQPYANIISMTNNVIDCIIASFVCLFFGPWSDKYGRKPVLLISLSGFTCNYILYTTISYFENTSPWLLLMALIFSFAGGFASFLTVAFSYVTDITSEENRGARMGTLEAAMLLGLLAGTISSSYLLQAVGYYFSFAICGVLALTAVLYTFFLLPESVESESDIRFNDFFTTSHFKDMFQVVIKPRQDNRRAILLLMLALTGIYVFIMYDSTVLFLYLRRAFSWSLQKFTLFQTISQILWIIGTIVMVHGLHNWLEIPETVLLLVGLLSTLDGYLMYGLASKSWHIYAGGAVKMLGGAVSPLARTLISKVIESDEVGKIFSFLLLLETLLGIVVYPTYTIIYNATIEILPSAYNFVIAGIISIDIVIILAVMYVQSRRNSINYLNIQEDADDS